MSVFTNSDRYWQQSLVYWDSSIQLHTVNWFTLAGKVWCARNTNSLPRCGSWNSSRNAQRSSYKSKPRVRQYEHSSKQETEITHTVIWHGLDWANSSIISSISYLPLWSKQIDSAMKQRKGHFYQLRITTLLWPLVPVWLFAVILYSKCYYGNAETTAKNLHSYECIHRITGYHRITMNFVCSNITQQTLECHGSHKHMTSYSSCLMQ